MTMTKEELRRHIENRHKTNIPVAPGATQPQMYLWHIEQHIHDRDRTVVHHLDDWRSA